MPEARGGVAVLVLRPGSCGVSGDEWSPVNPSGFELMKLTGRRDRAAAALLEMVGTPCIGVFEPTKLVRRHHCAAAAFTLLRFF